MKRILFVALLFILAITQIAATASTINLQLILALIAGLVGLPALWSVIIDLLKLAGVVTDGTAGKWNAAFGLLTLLLVAIAVNFFPHVDIAATDQLLLEIAKFASLILGFIAQVWVANGTHTLTSRAVPQFSFSKMQAKQTVSARLK